MNLSFDSIDDLQEFLHWADKYRAPGSCAIHVGPATVQVVPLTGAEQWPKIDMGGVAFDTPQSALKGDHVALMDTPQPGGGHVEPGAASGDKSPEGGEPVNAAGKPLRKRRTKAEIAADEIAAAEKAGQAAIAAEAAAGKAQDEDTDKAAGGETAPTGTNPFEQVATAGDGAASDGEGPYAAEASGEEVVTPFLHLTRAREFIAKHGMPKYNESFTKAGLDPNVMGYNAEQRAQHMATLAELDKA